MSSHLSPALPEHSAPLLSPSPDPVPSSSSTSHLRSDAASESASCRCHLLTSVRCVAVGLWWTSFALTTTALALPDWFRFDLANSASPQRYYHSPQVGLWSVCDQHFDRCHSIAATGSALPLRTALQVCGVVACVLLFCLAALSSYRLALPQPSRRLEVGLTGAALLASGLAIATVRVAATAPSRIPIFDLLSASSPAPVNWRDFGYLSYTYGSAYALMAAALILALAATGLQAVSLVRWGRRWRLLLGMVAAAMAHMHSANAEQVAGYGEPLPRFWQPSQSEAVPQRPSSDSA